MNKVQEILNTQIRDVPDFPKPGIVFKDITPVLQNPESLREIIDHLKEHFQDKDIDIIVGVESRGFIFGTALAYAMGKGIALVRKPGKLPAETEEVSYDLEYGSDTLQIHKDAIEPGARVLIVDDLLATGGTAAATCQLVQKIGGVVAACAFVIELDFLKGRDKLEAEEVYSLMHY